MHCAAITFIQISKPRTKNRKSTAALRLFSIFILNDDDDDDDNDAIPCKLLDPFRALFSLFFYMHKTHCRYLTLKFISQLWKCRERRECIHHWVVVVLRLSSRFSIDFEAFRCRLHPEYNMQYKLVSVILFFLPSSGMRALRSLVIHF